MTRRPSADLPRVTDHAVLRWMERVEGYDIAALREAIAVSGAIGETFGASIVVVANGRGKLVLREGAVVTVLSRRQFGRELLGQLEIEIDADIAARRRTGRRRR